MSNAHEFDIIFITFQALKWYLNNPNYSWICIKYDPTDVTPVTMNFRHFAYLYYINKILDFLDTVKIFTLIMNYCAICSFIYF